RGEHKTPRGQRLPVRAAYGHGRAGRPAGFHARRDRGSADRGRRGVRHAAGRGGAGHRPDRRVRADRAGDAGPRPGGDGREFRAEARRLRLDGADGPRRRRRRGDRRGGPYGDHPAQAPRRGEAGVTERTGAMAASDHAVPDRVRARMLFAELSELGPDEPRRQRIRDELVELHLPLVEYLARRFRNRGEWLDDLTQVATIGLIKSIDRFDLNRRVEFSTYATPTSVGEIKRHFRDKGWAVRVPRRLQELKLSLTKAISELSQREGRAPTVAELASYLKMTEEEVLEGLESANAYSTVSLDAPDSGDDDAPAVSDSLGIVDESLEGVEYRESLKPLLERLPPREKRILLLRFFGNMTQSQIATELGISQMHVSRLLARTLAQLREGLTADD